MAEAPTAGFCGAWSFPSGFDWPLLSRARRESAKLMRGGIAGLNRSRAQWPCAASFLRTLDGLRCDGSSPRADVVDAASCQAACCTRRKRCDTWRFCASPGHCESSMVKQARCWIGGSCASSPVRLEHGWVGAARVHTIGYDNGGTRRAKPSQSVESKELVAELKACLRSLRPELL